MMQTLFKRLIDRRFLAATGFLLAAGCNDEAPPPQTSVATAPVEEAAVADPSEVFFEMADRHAKAYLTLYPEAATQLGVGAALAGEGYNARLAGYGFEAQEEMRRLNERFLQEIRALPRAGLSGDAAISYDVLKNAYELAARRNQFAFGGATPAGGSAPQIGASWAISPYYVTQLTGPHIYLPRMLQVEHGVSNAAEAEAYLTRLESFGQVFDDILQTVQSDAALGVTPPLFVIDGVVKLTAGMTAATPGDHALVTSFAEKMEAAGVIDAEAQEALRARAAALVEDVVYPAYARLGAGFEDLKALSAPGAGVWRLGPEGEDYYQLALDAYGGGGRTGAEVHDIGLTEVARITGEMDTILKSIGYEEGSVAERLTEMTAVEGAVFPNTDEGREALLQLLREQVADVMAIAPDWFATLPEQAVEVRRIPVYEQDSSPGGYYSGPSLDGARPGVYWINLKNTADSAKYGLATLTYHEAVPGHHFQISLQQAVETMPLMRNLIGYSEYAEGWALYGEALAKEMGMYEEDPEGDLGRLQAELFRAARLVVDTGLHHKRWTREQAIDYMVAATGETRASVTREVERYAAVPGQACSYKLGMLRIQEMRARAEAELGAAFDIRAFHDVILLAGAMPMEVLDARVSAWIEDVRS